MNVECRCCKCGFVANAPLGWARGYGTILERRYCSLACYDLGETDQHPAMASMPGMTITASTGTPVTENVVQAPRPKGDETGSFKLGTNGTHLVDWQPRAEGEPIDPRVYCDYSKPKDVPGWEGRDPANIPSAMARRSIMLARRRDFNRSLLRGFLVALLVACLAALGTKQYLKRRPEVVEVLHEAVPVRWLPR